MDRLFFLKLVAGLNVGYAIAMTIRFFFMGQTDNTTLAAMCALWLVGGSLCWMIWNRREG